MLAPLNESEVPADPLALFRIWLENAQAAGGPDPEAMSLATATPDGVPSCRIVLLRGFDERGFVFYTNYESRKGDELSVNPQAALTLFWAQLKRQIRIEGTAEVVTEAESDAYFQTRPRGHRLAAWASPQSRVLPDRDALDENLRRFFEKHPQGDIPRPPFWGGYRVIPKTIEFWQGRENRMHDRLRYTRMESGWLLERLAP